MSPWIESTRDLSATRWLDESDVALRALVTGARATAIGALVSIHPMTALSFGRSSVSGTLSVNQKVQGASAGQSQVSGLLGYTYEVAGQSSGSSQVSGELLVGQAQFVTGVARGSTAVSGDLSVKRYSNISGKQAGDNWGSGADLPPMGGGRDDGPTRRRFSKNSSGRVTGALA